MGLVRESQENSRAPSTPPGQVSGDCPFINATANDLGFQELAAALTPVCTGVEACISVNAAASVTMLVTRLKPRSHYGAATL